MAKKLMKTDTQTCRHADEQTSKVVISDAFCSKKNKNKLPINGADAQKDRTTS